MVKIKHSKVKNTGLIYLILVRNISIDILLNKKNSPAISILKNCFKYGTQLNLEYLLYNILLTNKVNNFQQALMLLNEVIQLHNKIDNKKLLQLKYNIILKIKLCYDLLNLFLTRIPLYKVLASIYKIFLSKLVTESYNPVDIINSKQIVLLFLTNNILSITLNNLVLLNFIRQDKDTQVLAYKLLILRFNKKYTDDLNKDQQLLLNKYMHGLSNVGVLKLYLYTSVPVTIDRLLLINKKITDSVVKIKIQLVLYQLNTIILSKIIKDSYIIALLKTYSLILLLEEVK